jgi:hypothetical protein
MVSATTLILMILIVLMLLTACDRYKMRLSTPPSPYNPMPSGEDARRISSASKETIPADRFQGRIPGYIFNVRNGVLGYHIDRPENPMDMNTCNALSEPVIYGDGDARQ